MEPTPRTMNNQKPIYAMTEDELHVESLRLRRLLNEVRRLERFRMRDRQKKEHDAMLKARTTPPTNHKHE